jgi:hypothetical protein
LAAASSTSFTACPATNAAVSSAAQAAAAKMLDLVLRFRAPMSRFIPLDLPES